MTLSTDVTIKSNKDLIVEKMTVQLSNNEISQEAFDSFYTMLYPTPQSIEARNNRLRNAILGIVKYPEYR
jgi:hypothetical protein